MSGNIITNVKLQKLFTSNKFAPDLKQIVLGTSNIVEANYKKEVSVDTGLTRDNVVMQPRSDIGYMVTTTATNNGKPYPFYLFMGTGAFKGVDKDYGHARENRVRRGQTNRGAGGIKPNKFARRARDNSEPKVMTYINRQVKTLLRQP